MKPYSWRSSLSVLPETNSGLASESWGGLHFAVVYEKKMQWFQMHNNPGIITRPSVFPTGPVCVTYSNCFL